MSEYDYLVAGSGASGMAMSLLLAMSGAKVLLVEKSNRVGGSLQRFRREGIPFDTGFHFTTALQGCFGDMFRFLGLYDSIREEPLRKEVYASDRKQLFQVPDGTRDAQEFYASSFPDQAGAIRDFFRLQDEVYHRTKLFSLDDDSSGFPLLDLDEYDTLRSDLLLDRLRLTGQARMLLPAFAVCCCGTPVTELSAASLFRISYGLHDKLVRFRCGGESVIRRFLELAEKYRIEIRTGCAVAECLEKENRECHRVRLTDGTEVKFRDAVLTMHPRAIADLIPETLRHGELQARVRSFEESCGFFTVFGVMDRPVTSGLPMLTSYMTHSTGDHLMDPAYPDVKSAGIMLVNETADDGRECQTVTIFENVYEKETEEWKALPDRKNSSSYRAYKQRKCAELVRKTEEVHPELKGNWKVLETASMLTYRDYLSPFGSAYGIRQKTGQFNLFGRLPLRNFYAAGQNALLPGAMGAMQSSFILWRKIAGEETYRNLLKQYRERNTAV